MNPILVINDAGHGETPPCPAAKFEAGAVVKVSRRLALSHVPGMAIVAVAVPSGFPSEYALADLLGEPRPLMITKPLRCVSYILVNEGDPKPYQVKEADLRPSGLPPVEIGSVRRAE